MASSLEEKKGAFPGLFGPAIKAGIFIRHRRRRFKGIRHETLASSGLVGQIEPIKAFVGKNAPHPAFQRTR